MYYKLFTLSRSRLQICVRTRRCDCVVGHLLLDSFDGVGAPPALRAETETGIDLAHAHSLRSLRNGGAKLLIIEHVAGTDDHSLAVTRLADAVI
jgi:hypothetical protein